MHLRRQKTKKKLYFTGKFWSFERRRYLCTTKLNRWIHLRVRIRASHARHRGSNPLSTTKRRLHASAAVFCCIRAETGVPVSWIWPAPLIFRDEKAAFNNHSLRVC